jgi:uncharacterized protein (DUF4415 family)
MKGKTNWKKFRALTDADIERAVAEDPDTFIPDDAWFKDAKWVMPEKKESITLRLDPTILQWFRKHGPGYQSRMNAVLLAFVESQGKSLGKKPRRT